MAIRVLRSKVVRFSSLIVLCGCAHLTLGAALPSQRMCATCHPAETARFQASAMGRSLVAPEALPPGRVVHQPSRSVIVTQQRDGHMVHTLSEQGLTAEHAVQYQVGGSLMGRTYLVQIGKTLFESPASWFNRAGWDISPGYARLSTIDFDRPVEQQCLFCHAGKASFDVDGRQLQQSALLPISCERCHGAGEAHLAHPSRKNIVNPAKLTGALRDSICEQCHLEGVTRVLNRGKNWNDFNAGEPTQQTFATYVEQSGRAGEVIAVSHVEQLAQSQCARQSGGKLACTTCHDPHGAPVVDRVREIKEKCKACHATLSAVAHVPEPAECNSCHMPRAETTDIAHAAVTDHRILRRPAVTPGAPDSLGSVIAWRDPEAGERARNLAMAQVVVGFAKNRPALSTEGLNSLRALPAAAVAADPAVLSALEGFALQQQDLPEAVRLGKLSVAAQPYSAKAALNYGIVLKRTTEMEEAERQLNRAIELDPSLKEAYMELGMLYASQRSFRSILGVLDRYLHCSPQDIMFNLQKARLPTRP